MDRRRHSRYTIDNNVVIVAHGSQAGNVLNISEGGLCCRCIIDGKQIVPPEKIHIFHQRINLKALEFPVKLRSIHNESGIFIDSMKMRFCHFEFKNLSESHGKELGKLIKHHAS